MIIKCSDGGYNSYLINTDNITSVDVMLGRWVGDEREKDNKIIINFAGGESLTLNDDECFEMTPKGDTDNFAGTALLAEIIADASW